MQTRDVINRIYQLYSAGDLAGAFGSMHEDVCYRWNANTDLARFAGTCASRAEMAGRLEELLTVWEPEAFEPTDPIVEGDRAASRVRIRYRHRTTGKVLESELAHFWTLRDGRVAELVEFYDTAYAEATMR